MHDGRILRESSSTAQSVDAKSEVPPLRERSDCCPTRSCNGRAALAAVEVPIRGDLGAPRVMTSKSRTASTGKGPRLSGEFSSQAAAQWPASLQVRFAHASATLVDSRPTHFW